MFCKHDQDGYRETIPGIRMKTVVYGEKTLMTEFLLEGGSFLPAHNHLHEQTGYLISGKIFLTIGDERLEVNPGDSWNIPGEVSHSAEAVKDSVAVEVFSPRRDEYII
ncbi:MAG: cupin domain-containing protein [Methanosarcina sp.]|uniref:cupin domain-containing protein n=1 Tax=Methanosarcina sp. TaxID=2213 RepID=UPI002636337F|nr:cupin domain-containing protein [Methanosarcina sp.]MDD3245996.1 cupin domain-containing protein [Methanosarcina sp.]MDD4250120.1 cupin domain-containing protein [Methanosarcina sp.]